MPNVVSTQWLNKHHKLSEHCLFSCCRYECLWAAPIQCWDVIKGLRGFVPVDYSTGIEGARGTSTRCETIKEFKIILPRPVGRPNKQMLTMLANGHSANLFFTNQPMRYAYMHTYMHKHKHKQKRNYGNTKQTNTYTHIHARTCFKHKREHDTTSTHIHTYMQEAVSNVRGCSRASWVMLTLTQARDGSSRLR
jgi:hypothetical protein